MAKVAQRSMDLVARYGGEEFAIILPFTRGEGALKVAEAIREEISKLQIPHDLSQVSHHVTLSLGVSSIIPSLDTTGESLVEVVTGGLQS